ncbi:MAG: FAD-dependent oxidoreductase [Rhodospirillaceae bacterium]|nr:FAD-dependent oxidoreductase [Rhodospirillaceae bacterium]
MQGYDVVIVGGGVIGSSIAYFLKASSAFSGSVAVVEKDPTYALASSPRSLGGIRQQFSITENIEIGLFAHKFIENVSSYLSLDGETVDLGWFERGYLYLVTEAGRDILIENNRLQRKLGAKIDLMTPGDMRVKFPWINIDGIEIGSFGSSGEGWIDPNSLLNAFKKKALSLGVVYIHGEVVDIEKDEEKITSVKLTDGSLVGCDIVVNAAGAWAGKIAQMSGFTLPVVPRKRIIYVIDCREKLEPKLPLVIDTSGVFIRSEGSRFVCGVSPTGADDPDAWEDFEVEYRWFEEIVWPSIAHRIPAFDAVKVTSAWAGWYDYNFVDQNGIIGRHPEIKNMFLANGFSGHGLQQSPAIGRAIMELITTGNYQTINLSRFGFERIQLGNPLMERNVI